jgi:hypothetical protein
MYGYLKYYLLINHACGMSFFSVEIAMAEETEVEVIGTEAQEGPGSPYILTLIHKSSTNCFMPDFQLDWAGNSPT